MFIRPASADKLIIRGRTAAALSYIIAARTRRQLGRISHFTGPIRLFETRPLIFRIVGFRVSTTLSFMVKRTLKQKRIGKSSEVERTKYGIEQTY